MRVLLVVLMVIGSILLAFLLAGILFSNLRFFILARHHRAGHLGVSTCSSRVPGGTAHPGVTRPERPTPPAIPVRLLESEADATALQGGADMGDTADRAAYTAAHIDDIPFEEGTSPTTEWKPIRRFFGIDSFGTNLARATVAGDVLTHDHDEVEANHEELFLIVSGHAMYRVGVDE